LALKSRSAIRTVEDLVSANGHVDRHPHGYVYLDPATVRLLTFFEVDLVLDVGANQGQFARELIRAGYKGRIVSFEPLAAAHARLVEASRGEQRWTVAERCAIGDHAGIAILNVAGNSESSSLLPMLEAHEAAAPAARYVGSETVALRRLDEVAADEVAAAARPFLKLDVQGYEHFALQGAVGLLPRIVGIQAELNLAPLYEGAACLEEMLGRLRELGFAPYRLIPGFSEPRSGRMLQVDGVFFRDSSSPA
jgi:FkbM family methyltransferase